MVDLCLYLLLFKFYMHHSTVARKTVVPLYMAGLSYYCKYSDIDSFSLASCLQGLFIHDPHVLLHPMARVATVTYSRKNMPSRFKVLNVELCYLQVRILFWYALPYTIRNQQCGGTLFIPYSNIGVVGCGYFRKLAVYSYYRESTV